jgi:putative phosphoesterase
MKLAIASDFHDNFHNTILFLQEAKANGAEKLILLGDYTSPSTIKLLVNSKLPIIMIWGNNDGEKVNITKLVLSHQNKIQLSATTYDFLEIDNRKIFITHYNNLAKPMAKSGDFDVVFYGHNHQKKMFEVNNCLVINPGEICALRTGLASFALYDTNNNQAKIITLENSISTRTNLSLPYIKAAGMD